MRTRMIYRIAMAGAALAIVTGACSSGDTADEPIFDPSPTASQLEAELATLVAKSGVPAIGAAAVSGTEQLDIAVAGNRSRTDDTPVAVDDVFHLGSNTKAMTAALLGILSQQGRGVSFDTTLVDAFPNVTIHPDYAAVTLADLLAHTAGTPGDTPVVDDAIFELPILEQRALAAELVLTEAPEVAPGTISRYSNTGFVIAGAAMEAATGSSWEELMAAEIFAPLEMDSCGFGVPAATVAEGPLGHDAAGEPIAEDLPPILGPAGTAHCSMSDWGLFLSELLNAANGNGSLLEEATAARLLTPIDGVPVETFDTARVALGWIVYDGPDGPVYWHNGSNTMWYSEAYLVPAIDRVVFGVSNEESTGSHAIPAALAALAEMYPG